jgi:hypothetical protein
MPWVDRNDPARSAIGVRVDDPPTISDDSIAALSYGDYFDDYRIHPEAKMLARTDSHATPGRAAFYSPAT